MSTVDLFLNPNIAYLLLVAGFLLAIMALLSPGTGLFEIGAFLVLVLAGWQVYNSAVNGWALAVLTVGVFPFLLAVRKSGKLIYLGLSMLALVIGSTFLFQGEGWKPAVNPVLAGVVSVLTSGFMWVVTVKTLEAQSQHVTHDIDSVVGLTGITRTEVFGEGTVYVKMEEWSAQSRVLIPANTKVRVLGREGFVLIVEPLETK